MCLSRITTKITSFDNGGEGRVSYLAEVRRPERVSHLILSVPMPAAGVIEVDLKPWNQGRHWKPWSA
jgi:hypothetical protein